MKGRWETDLGHAGGDDAVCRRRRSVANLLGWSAKLKAAHSSHACSHSGTRQSFVLQGYGSQPVQIDPISPYTYFHYFLQRALLPEREHCIATIIASSHNAKHLSDRRYWQCRSLPLGTIWLTRNWTLTQSITKATELENRRQPLALPQ